MERVKVKSASDPSLGLCQYANFVSSLQRALRQSLRTVLYLLRIVGFGILWTAFSLFAGSLGNFLTGKSVPDQTGAEILATTMMWNQLMFCGFSIATQSAFLTRQRFLDQPDRPASYATCVKRVLKATWFVSILSSIFPVCVVFVLGVATGDSSCMLHWSTYIVSIDSLVFTALLTIAVRRLFSERTVAGAQRQQKRLQESEPPPATGKRKSRRIVHNFIRVMFQVSPGTLSNVFAAAYVQVSSAHLPSSQRDLAIFAICSIGLKLFVQELIKLVTVKRKITDIRTMFLVVAVPTVMIDTQVRVMLQLANNTSTTIGGSILMAFVEIGMRTGKMLYLRAQIYRKSRNAYAPTSVRSSRFGSMITIFPVHKDAHTQDKRQREESVKNFEIWKMQMLRFHAAEAYADMAAEYVALASSAMIVAVYADHPKYELSQWQFGTNSSSSNESSRYAILLGLQLAIEFVVDTVSCLVETANGVNFDELKKYESFVMALFIVIGIMNVQITAVMYLKCT